METLSVQLPSGNDINTVHLAKLIARCLYPSLIDCEGISCVVAKLMWAEFRVPLAPGYLPVRLESGDLQKLQPLLPALPKIRSRMNQTEIEDFMEAYLKHPNQLNWMPSIATQHDIDVRCENARITQVQHLNALQQKILLGEIKAYDANHIPQKNVGYQHFISRSDAVRYLTAINMFDVSDPYSQASFSKSGSTVDLEIVRPQTVQANTGDPAAPATDMKFIKHNLDEEQPPNLPLGKRQITQLAIKAAWQIQKETGRKASPAETFALLIEWTIKKHKDGRGYLLRYDAEKKIIIWIADSKKNTSSYDLGGCRRAINEWHKTTATR